MACGTRCTGRWLLNCSVFLLLLLMAVGESLFDSSSAPLCAALQFKQTSKQTLFNVYMVPRKVLTSWKGSGSP